MSFLGKLFGWGKKEPPKPPEGPGGQTLTDLTRGMQHAVNRAQEILERHYIEVLDRYFDTDKDEKTGIERQYPKIITFKIDGADLHVPLISLVPPGGLTLDKMRIKMAVRIDKADVKKAGPQAYHKDDHLTRTSMQVSFASLKATQGTNRDMNAIEMTMFFKAGDAPEGVSRILEHYVNSIKPTDRREPPPEGVTNLQNGKPPEGSGPLSPKESPDEGELGTGDGGADVSDAVTPEHHEPEKGPQEGSQGPTPNPNV